MPPPALLDLFLGTSRNRRLSAVAFCWISLVCVPPGRAELEPDPRFYNGWKISHVDLMGAPKGLEGALKSGISISGHRKWIFWKKYPPFSNADLEEDLQRIRLHLAGNGYPYATVTPHFEAQASDKRVAVTIEVSPGPAVVVSNNRTEAFPQHLEPEAAAVLQLEAGELFSDSRVDERQKHLLDILTKAGYARAQIGTQLTYEDSTHVAVLFLVNAGTVYYFGRTRIEGPGDDLVEMTRRTVAIKPGSRYTPDALARAEESLRILDLFRKVRVVAVPGGADTLDVLADLAERKQRSVEATSGYWTEEQFQVTAGWRDRNLFHRGHGIGVSGSYSQFRQQGTLSFWKPALFHSRARGVLSFRGRRENEPNFFLRTGEVEAAVTYAYSIKSLLRPSVTVSLIDYEIKAGSEGTVFDPGPSLISSAVRWTYDTLDDKVYPHRGIYADARVEEGWPGFRTKANYVLLQPEGVIYRALGKSLVFATRLRFGYAFPMSSAVDLLPNKRFYGGGANSVRGFERRMLGPLDEAGRPIGGIATITTSIEMRFPIVWILGGAIFVDAGNVWRDRDSIRPTDLELSAGPGLGIRTPVGPIRADLGFRLTEVEHDLPKTVFHLTVGHVL